MRIGIQLLIFMLLAVPLWAQAPPPAQVVVDKVTEKNLSPTTEMVGSVDFDLKSDISSEIGGLVRQQALVEGAIVKKGAVLVELNTDFLIKDTEILEKEINRMEVKIRNSKKNLTRFETLFKEKAASEKDYDDLSDQLKELELDKEILEQKLDKKHLEIDKSKIRAPFDGMVLAKNASQGEWVATGSPLCTLASVKNVFLKVAVSERLVRYIRSGESVSGYIDSLDRAIEGKIVTIVPVADPKSKTFQAKIAIPYAKGLLQNMSARINVPSGAKTALRMIKRDALVRFQGKEFVYTVKDDKAKIVPVTIVSIDGEYLGVNDPYISAGMPVVVDGNERLRPDQPVKVVEKP